MKYKKNNGKSQVCSKISRNITGDFFVIAYVDFTVVQLYQTKEIKRRGNYSMIQNCSILEICALQL